MKIIVDISKRVAINNFIAKCEKLIDINLIV